MHWCKDSKPISDLGPFSLGHEDIHSAYVESAKALQKSYTFQKSLGMLPNMLGM